MKRDIGYMEERATETRISFVPEGETLRVKDLLEQTELFVEADRTIDLSPALTDLFVFPVDRAVSFETESLYLSSHSEAQIRTIEGEFIETLAEESTHSVGNYLLDITGYVRTYIRVKNVEIWASGRTEDDSLRLEFDSPTTVTVGARSLHTRPEATITVPDDPTAAMEAVGYLGSSIKEFSSERSWSTLRGHPPRIRLGDRLDIPDALRQPETGVRISIPPTYSDLYRVAPLAFYLGATVEEGENPALHLDNGYTEPLTSGDRTLEDTATELLKRFLLLDSLVRTDGYIPSNRYEYDMLGPDLPFYPPNLYGKPLSAQLIEYLEVERSVLKPYYPGWSTTAVLRSDRKDVELLPYLAHMLSPICVGGPSGDLRNGYSAVGEAGDGTATGGPVPDGWVGWSGHSGSAADVSETTSDPLASNAALLNVDTYENAFESPPAPSGEATAAFVTDNPTRARRWRRHLGELPIQDVPVEAVDVVSRPGCEKLRTLLSGDYDLVYVASASTSDAINCSDGQVDPTEVDDVGTRITVFESTCCVNTLETLVHQGGVAGVEIDDPVPPGRLQMFVALLGIGFPLGVSVRVAFGDESIEVRIVGEPGHQLAYTVNRLAPYLVDFDPLESSEYDLTLQTFVSTTLRIGAEWSLTVDWLDKRQSLLGMCREDYGPVSADQLLELANLDDSVVQSQATPRADPHCFTKEDIRRAVRRSQWNRSEKNISEP